MSVQVHKISTKNFKNVQVVIYTNEENIRCADVSLDNKFIGTAEYATPYPSDPDLLDMYTESLEEWIINHN